MAVEYVCSKTIVRLFAQFLYDYIFNYYFIYLFIHQHSNK